MKHLYAYLMLSCLSIAILKAQNLVPNNSFENYTSIPSGYGQWYVCATWNDVNNHVGFAWPYASPDYLHTAASTISGVKLPATTFGTVNAHTGNAAMGLASWLAGTPNYREYISIQLSSPMIIGTTYEISYYITNATNSYNGSSCDHMAVNLSLTPLSQIDHEVISASPQCDYVSQIWNTVWMQVSFTYTPTVAYKYITIGHFKDDANTLHTYHGPGQDGAYYFIDDVVVEPLLILPLELTSFSGLSSDAGNVLQWKTTSEFNTHYFSIERSEDAFDFYEAGRLEAQGNANAETSYSFIDDSALNAKEYYRLRMVDLDGKFSYSATIGIAAPFKDFNAVIKTNPFKDVLVIHFESANEIAGTYEVRTYSGALLNQSEINNQKGSFDIKIKSGNWTNGIYYVTIITRQGNLSLRAVKQE